MGINSNITADEIKVKAKEPSLAEICFTSSTKLDLIPMISP